MARMVYLAEESGGLDSAKLFFGNEGDPKSCGTGMVCFH